MNSAHDLALKIALDLDRAHDLAHDLDHDLARDVARDLARDLARALARDLDHDLARALDLARGLVLAHNRALDFAHDLARALARALALVDNYRGDSDPAASRAGAVVGDLLAILKRCVSNNRRLIDLLASVRVGSGEPDEVRPSAVARRLIGHLVRLVPAAHRPRYGEEFRGDLAHIAQDGNWWAQLGFAVRALGRVLVLRSALRGVSPDVPERVGPA